LRTPLVAIRKLNVGALTTDGKLNFHFLLATCTKLSDLKTKTERSKAIVQRESGCTLFSPVIANSNLRFAVQFPPKPLARGNI
jgi:hypothetical protein